MKSRVVVSQPAAPEGSLEAVEAPPTNIKQVVLVLSEEVALDVAEILSEWAAGKHAKFAVRVKEVVTEIQSQVKRNMAVAK